MTGKTIIETPRLILREFVEEDAGDFYVLGSHPEIIRYTGDPGGGFADVDQATEILRSHPLADYERYGYGRWAVIEKASHRLIGFAGPKFLPEFDEADLGYRLLPEYWGRGMATEAARAVVDTYFGSLGGRYLMALVLPENLASVRVLHKLGMTSEGEADYDGIAVQRYGIRVAED